MAQIDLRHAKIYLIDGYSKVGAVNQVGSPPANGDATLTISGFSEAIPVGMPFTVEGANRRYQVTGSTGGSSPTAITFSPPLATADGIPDGDAVLTIGPHVLEISIGEGNLTFEEKRNINYVREKKSIVDGFVMTGDDEPMDVSLDFIWEFLSSDTGDPPTPHEAFNKIGNAADWVTSGGDACEPYAVDIELLYQPPCTGVPGERILLEEFRWESMSHDARAGTVGGKGKCKALLATVTREEQPLVP